MTAGRLRRVVLALVDAVAWLAPGGERDRWRAQWHADLWHRCNALERAGLINARTTRALVGRAAGAAWHALHLRIH